jgi:HK97 gp10 family phage protein
MAYSIKIEGVKELKLALDKLGEEIKDKLQPALHKGAEIVAQKATSNIERNTEPKTGRLSRSMVVKDMPYKDSMPLISIAAVDRKIAPHAHLIEFGTTKMSARPFLRPALQSSQKEVEELIENTIEEVVNKAGSE